MIITDHINNFLTTTTGIITIKIDVDDFDYFISDVTIANCYRRVRSLFGIGSGTMRSRITFH